MSVTFQIGARVLVRLDAKSGTGNGWYSGTVLRIDPYSKHRAFYWVRLDEEARQHLGFNEISVFNPRNIKPLESP